jgi:hypothetical protein
MESLSNPQKVSEDFLESGLNGGLRAMYKSKMAPGKA